MAITYMTKEGYKKKMEEIAFLENVKRPEISRAIAEARDKGDLSENAEYDAAKEAQGMLEMKISQLKDLVANARILDDSKLNTDQVQILNRVKIKNVANGQVMEYTIVADSEANLREKKIASSTPIAQGLLGHSIGDVVEIRVPSGLMKFEIVEISFLMASIFSRIAAGEIPCYKIAADERHFAFLDINPVAPGHVLVIPRREVPYIFDLTDEETAALHTFARRVARAVGAAMPCKRVGMTVIGLEVPHAHIHLIPINVENDMNFAKGKLTLPEAEMSHIAEAIRAEYDKIAD